MVAQGDETPFLLGHDVLSGTFAICLGEWDDLDGKGLCGSLFSICQDVSFPQISVILKKNGELLIALQGL